MLESTPETVSDEIDLETLEPLWPEPSVEARPASARRQDRMTRNLVVLGLVIAAAVAGVTGAGFREPRVRTITPSWVAACQHAINATARLDRLRDLELSQGMAQTWTLITGGEVPEANPIQTALHRRLARDARDATSRCVSPVSLH